MGRKRKFEGEIGWYTKRVPKNKLKKIREKANPFIDKLIFENGKDSNQKST